MNVGRQVDKQSILNNFMPPLIILAPTDGTFYNVERVKMFLTEEYKSKYYNSMKDVSLPAANMKAIVALCGSANCDEKKMFEFVGDNPLSPFPIDYTSGKWSKYKRNR